MHFTLREPTPQDWPGILALADLASPWKSGDNPDWLENRKQAGTKGAVRFQLLAETVPGQPVGYAALEAGDRPGWLRVFLVVAPGQLNTVGEQLYRRLEVECQRIGPTGVWLREEPGDAELLDFFANQGFIETYRGPTAGGLEIVVMECRSRSHGD